LLLKKITQVHTEVNEIIDFERFFYEAVEDLINGCYLKVGEAKVNLKEVEVYFHDAIYHPDPYAHRNDTQLETGTFYVHRQTWNRGGIDITFGNREKKQFGGILIRGIESNGDYISGPGNVKKYIAELLNIQETNHTSLQNEIHRVSLHKRPQDNAQKVYSLARKGLRFNKGDSIDKPFKPFIFREYRFVVDLKKEHKFST